MANKLTISQRNRIKEEVVDYLSNESEYNYADKLSVLQTIYNKLYDNPNKNNKELEQLIAILEKKTVLTPTEQKLLQEYKNGPDTEVSVFKNSDIPVFFDRAAYVEASFRRINRELSSLVKTERVIYDDDKIHKALKVIKDCYGISNEDMRIILAMFSQIKLRIKCFHEAGGDIRSISSYKDFGIMPAFYGPQGCGKSEFASAIGRVIGSYCEHGIDDILGNYGSEDVFYKPLIVMNEFGRQNKNNLDMLKSYINGEVVTVNKKYKDPVIARCFANFILTSNFDPEMLKGTELGSRRICVVNFNNPIPGCSLEEVEQAISDIWNNCDETTFEKFFSISKEDLSRQNLKEQTEAEIAEFRACLSEDDIEYFTYKRTRKQARDWLYNTHHYPQTFVDNLLKQETLFIKTSYNKATFYELVPEISNNNK